MTGLISKDLDQAIIDINRLREPRVVAAATTEPRAEEPKQADRLIAIANTAELFHTPDGTGYADIKVNGHRETRLIRSQGFRRWLNLRFYEDTGTAPSTNAMGAALGVIEARAQFSTPERKVYLRVAGHDRKIYLDLADDHWRAIEIDAARWRSVNEPPVRFRRTAGMLPLPMPVRGGKVESLRQFLNVKNNDDFVLAVAWLLGALRDCGPYPVLALSGEQGSAKSTFSTILRSLIDPNTAPLRALPREDRDLFIAANNGHSLAFDNVSGMPVWISDTLCRLSSGGGFALRQLYTDQDEVLFDSCRPIILNGIEDCIGRPDLADRAVFLALEAIPEKERKLEKELMAEFSREQPRILGALLDAVSHGLRELPKVRLDRLPRMADFAKWATACETAMWKPETFASAYGSNRAEAVNTVLEADSVATAICSLMASRTEWTGTATELLSALSNITGEAERKSKTWPTAPNKLSGRLRRAATFLRQIGITIEYGRDQHRRRERTISVTREERTGNLSSEPSEPSSKEASLLSINGLTLDDRLDDKRSADDTGISIVRDSPLKNKASDDVDDTDDKTPALSLCGHCGKSGGVILPFGCDGRQADLHPGCREAWIATGNDNLAIPPYLDRRAELST
jgi:hypothetical protein